MTVSTLNPGTVSARREVPDSIVRPLYVDAAPGTPADFDDLIFEDADALVEVGRHVAPTG